MDRVQLFLQTVLVILSAVVLTMSLTLGQYWTAAAYTIITAVNIYLFKGYANRVRVAKQRQVN